MIVEPDVIEDLFSRIEGFREEIRKAGGNPEAVPVSMETMRAVASKLLNLKIDAEKVSFEAEHLCSMVIRKKDSAVILVREDLPERMIRGAFTKELSHLLFDAKDSWTIDAVGTVSDLIEHRSLEVRNGNQPPKNKTVYVEEIASFCSTELLYPHEIRSSHRALLDTCKISYRKISIELNIPQWMASEPYLKWYKALEVYRPPAPQCFWCVV